jgi:phosphopantetheinyl transferase
MLVVAIDTKKVAVDIEYIHPRNESLLQNVRIPDSQYSPRENFYLQWCAKECLVKYLDLTNTETSEMTVTAFMPNHYFAVDAREFNCLIIIHYR